MRTERFDGIGDWFLETSKFLAWRDGEDGATNTGSVLFCSGNPGVGKRYLRGAGAQALPRKHRRAGCPEAMDNGGFVFSVSAWEYGKEEMEA